MPRARSVCSALLVAAALCAAACGEGDGETTATPTPEATEAPVRSLADVIVTGADVKAAKSPPAAALLRWWRALQFDDVDAVATAYASAVDTAAVKRHARKLRGSLNATRPLVLETEQQGDRAIVRTVLRSYAFDGKSGTPQRSETPRAFALVKQGDAWKLADDSFLGERYENVIEAQRAARGQG